MRERPILFAGPMVRAILEGRKTQTRRVVPLGWRGRRAGIEFVGGCGMEDDPESWGYADEYGDYYTLANANPRRVIPCPYGTVGDRLWVRETWSADCLSVYPCPRAWYRADRDFDEGDVRMHDDCSPPRECKRGPSGDCLHGFRWRPSIHMPRWASRLLLEISEVRVQRLQEISEEDARAEGVEAEFEVDFGAFVGGAAIDFERVSTYRLGFKHVWAEINGPDSWAANPWVWCVSFKRIEKEGR